MAKLRKRQESGRAGRGDLATYGLTTASNGAVVPISTTPVPDDFVAPGPGERHSSSYVTPEPGPYKFPKSTLPIAGGDTGTIKKDEESGGTVISGGTGAKGSLGASTDPLDIPGGRQPSAVDQLAAHRARMLRGQFDLSMMTPGLLSTLMARQRNRRRGYSGTIRTGGLGLDDEPFGGPATLLGD